MLNKWRAWSNVLLIVMAVMFGVTQSAHAVPIQTFNSDADGDGALDFSSDNCRATPNVSQFDADGDGLGGACDPNDATAAAPGPISSIVEIGGPYSIFAGDTLTINVAFAQSELSTLGYLWFDLDSDGHYDDGMISGDLAAIGTASIDVGFFSQPGIFDLDSPGVYSLSVRAGTNFAVSDHESTVVEVLERPANGVPEPTTLGLVGLALVRLASKQRRRE